MRLADLTQGRDNNFNLIRLTTAFAVLVSHSFSLTSGDPTREPLRASLGMTLGSLAVDVFFITSGFLVTASLLTRRSTLEFIWARVLRIYPAMLVMVVLCVGVLGAALTTQPLAGYAASPETQRFVLRNATLLGGVAYYLPGVFESNPYDRMVNGSLWTMPIEVHMYLVLTMLWLALKVTGTRRPAAMGRTVVALALGALVLHAFNHYALGVDRPSTRLFFMFFAGAVYYQFRDRIRLSGRAFVLAAAALGLATLNRELFFAAYNLLLAYVLFWLAYVPGGAVRGFNRLGDCSYGVYIYAFPIQQTVASLVPGIGVTGMVTLAGTATLVCGALSWHLVEKHALRLKGRAVAASRRAIAQAPATP